jgi:cell division protein FtsW
MARKLKSDRVLFTATFLLVCVSIVMVYSASALVALQKFDQPNLFLTKQALWTVLGLAVLAVAMRIDYRAYRHDTFIWSALGFVGLMLVAVLFASPVNGTRRWFGIGGLGIQPSELAKMAAVLFTALILERRMHRIDDLRYSMLPIAIVVGTLNSADRRCGACGARG